MGKEKAMGYLEILKKQVEDRERTDNDIQMEWLDEKGLELGFGNLLKVLESVRDGCVKDIPMGSSYVVSFSYVVKQAMEIEKKEEAQPVNSSINLEDMEKRVKALEIRVEAGLEKRISVLEDWMIKDRV